MGEQETFRVPFSTAFLTWLGLQPTLSPRVIPELESVALMGEEGKRTRWHRESSFQGLCFSNLNFLMFRGELQASPLFAGHWDGRETSGGASSWLKGFKASWGGEAAAPEIWRNSVCGVEEEGYRNEGHCYCRILKIGKCVLWVDPRGLLQVGLLERLF